MTKRFDPWPISVSGEPPAEELAADCLLPPGSYLPFARNPLFTGRETCLQALFHALLTCGPNRVVVSQQAAGLDGIGKTQLAVEFAWRYGDRFKGVHWLDLRDPEALDAAIALCGTKMGYSQTEQAELVAEVLEMWKENGPRLLILDHFEDVARGREVWARFRHPSLKLLVTSRCSGFPQSAGLQVYTLDRFTETESLDFLERSLAQAEPAAARKALAENLGHLPLALELAANYLNLKKVGIDLYLKELEDVLQQDPVQAEGSREPEVATSTGHDQNLLAALELCWRGLKNATQRKIFMIAGFCAPDNRIPLEIFKETLRLDDEALHKALGRLNALGLLALVDGLPLISPWLAAYARTQAASCEGLLKKLTGKLADLDQKALDQIESTGHIGWFMPLRFHVVSVAQFAEEAGIECAADLIGGIGCYLDIIADYPGAKRAYERALEMDEANLRPDHLLVARDLGGLGLALEALDDPAGAKAAFERALRIFEGAWGNDAPELAPIVNNLGVVLGALGDLTGARAAYERALILFEENYGPDDLNVAPSVINLGKVLHDLGDLEGAKAAFERALPIFEQVQPDWDPNIRALREYIDLVSDEE